MTLIFDLDGTLLDTLRDLATSVNHALSAFGMPVRTTDQIRLALGNGIEALVAASVPEGTLEAITQRVLASFRVHYLEHSRDTTAPYAGITELLQACRERGIRTAIVSNKLNAAVQELHAAFFAQWIEVAFGEQQPHIRRKPAPDMVEAAMAALGVDRSECVYVGDSEVDLQTAQNAHLPCVSVSWGFRTRAFLEQAGAPCIVDSPEEVIPAAASVLAPAL